ncbi:MAG: hypothetical protein KA028_02425 [Candidatus Pacebacteria bacterium]|nr:hypothetical protein [Candidatus Paceibacterota bacterium]
MKNIKYIIVLAIIVVLAIVASKNWKTKEELAALNNPAETPSETESASFCYIWNTEAGDSATLKLVTSDGINVTGEFNYMPFQKDSKKGTIKGSVGEVDEVAQQQNADLLWTASAEGVTNVEELSVILGAGTAKPGFGEMKLDPISGVYKYADASKVSYDLTLQRTECADAAVQ